jgi:salicylate hydroxylase
MCGCRSGSAAVVGAGLGGLTAALALQRAGWRVRVYEQAERLGEVGAGISVSPGAGRSLESLGLGPALLAASDPVPDVAFADYATGALLAGTLQKAPPVDRGFEEARHIHRADLHALLLDAVVAADPDAVVTGRRLVDVADDGSTVTMGFVDGSSAVADLLIGADGSRSAVRAALFGPGAPVFAGQVAYRCLIPRAIAEPYLGAGSAVVSVGPSRIFHRYLIRHGALVNVIGIARTDAWTGEGWNSPATNEEFQAVYADFNADVRGLIGCAPAASLIKWALYVRPPLETWSRGRVTLLGDAAHPILPFLGLGAALAIEDGVVLAQALEDAADIETGLAAFQSLRQDRVETVRTQTIRQGEIIQGEAPDAKTIAASPSQDQRLFQYDPTRAVAHG